MHDRPGEARWNHRKAPRSPRVVQCVAGLAHVRDAVLEQGKDRWRVVGAQAIAGTQVLIDPNAHGALIVAGRAVLGQTAVVTRIAIAADHAGFPLKQALIPYLTDAGHAVEDLGTHTEEPVDYPPLCAAAGRAVVGGEAEVGIVIGGSGQGEQIAANKVHGVRAALCHDEFLARLARRHNDANVLSMGARVVAPALAKAIVDVFLSTEFEGERHVARLEQLAEIEREECSGAF